MDTTKESASPAQLCAYVSDMLAELGDMARTAHASRLERMIREAALEAAAGSLRQPSQRPSAT